MKPIIPLALLAFAMLSTPAQAKTTTTTLAQNQVVDGQPRIVIFQYDGKNAFCLQVPKKEEATEYRVGCFTEGRDGAFNSTPNGNLDAMTWRDAKDEGTEICYAGEGRCPVPAELTDLLDPKANKEWGAWRP